MTAKTWAAWDDIAARNASIRVVRVPEAGHLPWFDEPERVVDELERFLTTPTTQRRTA